jgi:predicted RNA-binding Zn ribbon-like protein
MTQPPLNSDVPSARAKAHSPGHEHAADLETSLDFLNTLEYEEGFQVEHLPALDAAVDWLVGHGVIHDVDRVQTRSARRAEQDLERLRSARAAMRAVADAVATRSAAPAAALKLVNGLLRQREVTELVPTADGLAVGHRHVGDPVADALARLAEPLVNVVASGEGDRLRICANDECRWVFYDTSRTGRRRWCDMATCGNRAKAARHRARQRESASQTADGSSTAADSSGRSV